ncbi:HTH domain-containing protein [Methylobacterium sp. 285MFTsu5.1]|uniref:HTH domain-containing protein n=1 Tax=Methylobacterium sp. 285MFTsu5.1 TaxID=1172187 RepID=UPI00035FB2C9|nr:HTH domain-containing protein [Methylobacterium sp. 285MFTsu5.1]
MDSYLEIAQQVLRASRRPMSAAGILDSAYAAGIVPTRLYGRTQVKTLQARLSEDVLYSPHSAFFRTEPGYFFLNELVADPTIPVKFKEKFEARRRIRDLHVAPFLGIDETFVSTCGADLMHNWVGFAGAAEKCNAIHYLSSKKETRGALIVWTFSVVRRGSEVLSYRTGRYRNNRDTFMDKKTIGFPGVLSYYDLTLFSDGDYGARENSLNAIKWDLDISAIAMHGGSLPDPKPLGSLRVRQDDKRDVLLIVMDWSCPAWFEPTTRRLSLNDPRWLDLKTHNNFDDFEPWTRATLDVFCKGGAAS